MGGEFCVAEESGDDLTAVWVAGQQDEGCALALGEAGAGQTPLFIQRDATIDISFHGVPPLYIFFIIAEKQGKSKTDPAKQTGAKKARWPIDKYPWGVYDRGKKTGGDTMSCCTQERHKHRTPEEQKTLQNRLSRIEGQIRGLRGMIEKNAYCPDILTQSAAAAAALNAFNRELLTMHIRTCVAEDIRAGKDEVIDELTVTLQKLMK